MPDANKENTLNQLVGAAFGAAGQRCMALSTAILVGEAKKWLPELVERAKKLRVNAGNQLLDFASLALSPGFCIGLVQWEQSCSPLGSQEGFVKAERCPGLIPPLHRQKSFVMMTLIWPGQRVFSSE